MSESGRDTECQALCLHILMSIIYWKNYKVTNFKRNNVNKSVFTINIFIINIIVNSVDHKTDQYFMFISVDFLKNSLSIVHNKSKIKSNCK